MCSGAVKNYPQSSLEDLVYPVPEAYRQEIAENWSFKNPAAVP